MATADSHSEHDRQATIPSSRYWFVWIALLAGTLLTFGASHLRLPEPYHVGVALLIACAKSALVVLFFMHLYDHAGASRLVFVTSVFFVVLLIGLVLLDNATRFELLNPGRGATERLQPPGPDILSPR